jgi:hypothetical protein
MSCEECGFDSASVGPADAPAALRAFGRRYRAPLTRLLPGEDDRVLRVRPEPTVWSALEYAAHVRDVFGWYGERVRRILAEDRPVLDAIDPDATTDEGRYNECDPAQVADEVAAAAERLAALLEEVPEDGWGRVGLRNGSERSVLDVARGAVHEGNHHLLDIGRVLRRVRDQQR